MQLRLPGLDEGARGVDFDIRENAVSEV